MDIPQAPGSPPPPFDAGLAPQNDNVGPVPPAPIQDANNVPVDGANVPLWVQQLLAFQQQQQQAFLTALQTQMQHVAVMAGAQAAAGVANAQPPPPAPPRAPSVRCPQPEKFDGRAEDVERFLSEVEDSMLLQRDAFTSDRVRTAYMSRCFGSGQARNWHTGVQQTRVALLDDYAGYVNAFRAHFGDPDIAGTCLRKLEQLSQKTSAADYAARFNELHARVNTTPQVSMSLFTRGLKESVRVAMAVLDPPTTLDLLQQKAISVDNNLYKTKVDCRRSRGSAPNNSQSNSSAPASDAMEIDAIFAGHRGPLPEAEKARRKQFNLCRYCGGRDHQAPECPKKTANQKKATSGSGNAAPRP